MNDTAEKIDTVFRPFTVIREHQRNYPVDVEALAESFGIPVIKKDWPNDMSGAIGRDDKGYFIIVNKKHPEVRQRFTIAHEIAHYILHGNQIGEGIKDDWAYRSKMSETDERAANTLAAEILVPVDMLGKATVEVIGSPGIQQGQRLSAGNLSDVAKALNVSTTVLAIRLGVPT